MRQEVEVIVKLTYDADAKLAGDKLGDAIHDDICRLLDADSESSVEACTFQILEIKEEADIYESK